MLLKKFIPTLLIALSFVFSSFSTLASVQTPTLANVSAPKATTNITYTKAVQIAKKEVSGLLTEIDKDFELGALYFEIHILDSKNVEHEFDIRASNGKIIRHTKEKQSATQANRLRTAKISYDTAIATAKKETNAQTVKSLKLDYERILTKRVLIYEIDVIDSDNVLFEVSIDAITGLVLRSKTDFDD